MERGGAEFHIISTRGINCDIEQVAVLNNCFIVCLSLYPNQPSIPVRWNTFSSHSHFQQLLFYHTPTDNYSPESYCHSCSTKYITYCVTVVLTW